MRLRPPIGRLCDQEIVGLDFEAHLACLRAETAAGRDPELEPFAALLDVVAAQPSSVDSTVAVAFDPTLEDALLGAFPETFTWVTIASFFEPEGPPDCMQRAFLDYERYAAWTSSGDQRLLGSANGDRIVAVEARRSVAGQDVSARFQFRARPVRRGRLLLNLMQDIASPDRLALRQSRGLLLLFPEAGGSRVVEAVAAVYGFPPLVRALKNLGRAASRADLARRMENLRHRWREVCQSVDSSGSGG